MSKNTFIIKNGTIVNPAVHESFKADILIDNGVVMKIERDGIDMKNVDVLDADGMIVSPGFIDLHVHFREPGFEHKEDVLTGLQAAAAGGYAAVCTMPNTRPVTDSAETVKHIKQRAAFGSGVKVYPVAAATKGSEGVDITSIKELKDAGAVALSDDGKPVENTAILKEVMEKGADLGMIYMAHSEDNYLSKDAQMNDGHFSKVYGLKGNPSVGEASQIARECMLAEYLDVPIHIAHVSCSMSVDIIEYFKKRGAKVTAETAPHYITLTDEVVGKYGTNAKINPPLRSEDDRGAIIKALKTGVLDVIATDHAPHHQKEKSVDFNQAPPGIVGLETALPLVLKLYHNEQLTLERVVELFTGGFSILGIEGGVIKEGAAADITIFSTDFEWIINKEQFFSKSRNTPFDGFHVKGAVFYTIVDGKIIYSRVF